MWRLYIDKDCGLRTAVGVRNTTCNEIMYIESNKYPLRCRIQSQQLKFWLSVKKYIEDNPGSALEFMVQQARELNIPYLKHYECLEAKFETPGNCLKVTKAECAQTWKEKFEASAEDTNSKHGTYYCINPSLSSPKYLSELVLETERTIITRFRCGSHSLKIETGRFARPIRPRYQRLCKCNQGIQTILHCLRDCPLTQPFISSSYTNLQEIFDDTNIANNLFIVCKILKTPF